MEIKQLEIFACVAKRLSFSKAAEELFISQPTVSAQINALEKIIGAQLFVRNTKGVSLTKAGADFLIYAQKILTLRDQAVQSAGFSDKEASGAIDIISSTIPAQHLLPGIIADFQKQWPNVVFRVGQADSERVVSEMSGFKYDFGMVGTVPAEDRFFCVPIYADELVLITPKDFFCQNADIEERFSKIITESPFIMRGPGSGTRAEIENLFSKIGIKLSDLRVPAYFADTYSILSAVSKGMGVSLVSKVAAEMYVEAGLVNAIEIKNAVFTREIYLIYNKELSLSPMQQAFVEGAVVKNGKWKMENGKWSDEPSR